MPNKRIAIGVGVTILFLFLGSELIGLLQLPVTPPAESFIVSLIASFLGALVAQRNFMMPGFLAWAFSWTLAIYMLQVMAGPTSQMSVIAIAKLNLLAIVLSAFATLIGITAGQVLVQRRKSIAAAT